MAHRHADLSADGRRSLRSKNVAQRKPDRACDVLHQWQPDGPLPRSNQEDVKDSAARPSIGPQTKRTSRYGTVKKNRHIGSTLESLLERDGLQVEADAAALKRVLAWQVRQAMAEKKLTRSAMAREMRTSRTVVARLLDPRDQAITLRTLVKAADVLSKRIRLELA
jgi:antitoxin HicB